MKRKLTLLGLAVISASQCWAATAVFDFNEDPALNGSLTNYGAALWYPSGGVGSATNATDGYLQVTAAAASQRSAIIFQDFDNGSVVQGFTFECDLRIGNGTASPADGFSVSYARQNDPAVLAGDGYPVSNPATDGGIWAMGPNCEDNLPEEGTKTGISIGFDAWDSGTGSGCAGAGTDIIGVSVRVDGTLVQQFPTPVLNGLCADPTSLQTGPRDATGLPDGLCWAHLKVDLSAAGVLNVYWKGRQILTNYATTYWPSPGRLVFAGRTGDAYQFQQVDNIRITTIPAALALINQPVGFPDGFSITINDSGSSVVNPNTVTATLNGNPAAPLSATKNGAVTTVIYHGFPLLLPVGSTNKILISLLDTNNNVVSAERTFVVGAYATIPAADAVANVNTLNPGFRVLPWQSGRQPNRLYWTEEQLIGLYGTNDANLAQATDGGYIDFTGVFNFNINPAANGGADEGDFRIAAGYADSLFPGIPGANGLNGSSALEALMFLKFSTAGVYTLIVNSDDGFLLTEGKNPKDRFALRLGQFDGAKGSSDVSFQVAVPSAGIYPVRLIWENGNGELPDNGANLEFICVKDGVKYLINDPDPTNTTGIAAYYAGPQLPAYVSHVFPYDGNPSTRADKLVAQITDGSTTPSGAIQLKLDGVVMTAPPSRVGNVTTVSAVFTLANLMTPGAHTATLTWNDSGGAAHSNNWSFVVSGYVTLDPALSAPLASADASAPGFTLQVVQIDPDLARPGQGDSMANQVDSANALMGGLYFPWYATNTADLSGGSVFPPAYSNVWYWSNAIDFNIVTSPGDFPYDHAMPGIPGVTGRAQNLAAWFQGYAAFPAAGYYRMSISSDDGFRLTEGVGLTRQVLHMSGPGIDRDVAAVVLNTNNTTFGPSLPLAPISGPVAYFPNNGLCPMPPTNLVGKIAAINNTTCWDREYVTWAQDNGAAGVVMINDAQWGMPYVMGGTSPSTPITIPSVCVSGFGGEEQTWATPGLYASIGADAHLQIAVDDRGRGMGWTDFSFVVPQAGLYPLHLVYEQGGGGAGLEWASYDANTLASAGVRFLVEDTATPGSIKVYRALTAQPRPTISIVREGGVFKIYYTGVLRSASVINGSYQPVGGATSPYTIPTGSAPAMFYRASN